MKKMSSEPTLKDYQALIKELVIERGFEKETPVEVLLLLVEEVGELAKALRKINEQKVDLHSRKPVIEEEAADILWLLVDLCNRLGIDLQKAFAEKEKKNQNRKWS